MEKLVIKQRNKSANTVIRTIRMDGNTYQKILELSNQNGLSFNNVTNQIINYGLANLSE